MNEKCHSQIARVIKQRNFSNPTHLMFARLSSPNFCSIFRLRANLFSFSRLARRCLS